MPRTHRRSEQDAPRERAPQPLPSGGGCKQQIQILIMGGNVGGKLVLSLRVNEVEEDIDITLAATTTQIRTAFATHSELEEDNVSVTSSSGGTAGLPGHRVAITFRNGISLRDVEVVEVDETFMTGGEHRPYARVF